MQIPLSPQLVRQIKAALDQFAEKANQQQEMFYNTPVNRQALFDYLRKAGVSEEEWTDPNIFALAHFHCETDGLLETRPVEVPETAEERATRLEFEERNQNNFANQYRARRDEPTIEEKIRDAVKNREATIKAEIAATRKVAEDAQAKALADADLSNVPTVEWLQENGELPSDKVWAFSREQTRAYVRRLQQATLQNQIARSEARRQKAEHAV